MIPNFLGMFSHAYEGNFVGIDIGASSVKLVEFDCSGDKPVLLNAAFSPSPSGVIKNNQIVRSENVSAVVRTLLEANKVGSKRAVLAVPGPSVFTKKIQMPNSSLKELQTNIEFEAANYIPNSNDAVKIDFQILKQLDNGSLEVLLVAVKEDIVDSFAASVEGSGVDAGVVDVDYFALANMFEHNYPEELNKTVVLLSIGARYTVALIMHQGEVLFSGDISVGGRLYTDALCEGLQIKAVEAEQAKLGQVVAGVDSAMLEEIMIKTNDHVASELQRQIGFFWNAAGTEHQIEAIYLTGGGSLTKGLQDALHEKTKISCVNVDPLRNIDCTAAFEQDYLNEVRPVIGLSVGLALRRIGDKQHAIE